MVLRAWPSVRRASLFLQKAGDVLLSHVRRRCAAIGGITDPNRL